MYLIHPKYINWVCIPESFNMNISHQLFDYKIAFANSQCEYTNSKGDFELKTRFKTFVLKFLEYKNKSESKIYFVDLFKGFS